MAHLIRVAIPVVNANLRSAQKCSRTSHVRARHDRFSITFGRDTLYHGMRGQLLVSLVLVTGCVVEPEPDREDASTTASALAATWSAPARIGAVSSLGYYDGDPAISADGLELYFISDRGGSRRIYMSTRFSTADAWGSAVAVTALWGIAGNTDSGPELSHDGLTIWFTRRFLDQGPRLYVARRAIRSLGWGAPAAVVELGDTPVESPHVSRDGLSMWFSNASSGNSDIYVATRPTLDDSWRNVRAVNRLNSSTRDEAITTARTEREVYFDSMRGGSLRVYRSTRTPDTAWTIPAVVEELAGAARVDVSPDASYMVMTKTPIGGDPDIYESYR